MHCNDYTSNNPQQAAATRVVDFLMTSANS